MLPTPRSVARRLPDFVGAECPTVLQALQIRDAVVSARMIMKELPLFGDRNGGVFFEPWTDDLWKNGLGSDGFEGMCPLAIAATYAFLTAVCGVRAHALDSTRFLPPLDGVQLIASEDFRRDAPAVIVTAIRAIEEINYRDQDCKDCEDTICQKNTEALDAFCDMLAIYMAKSDTSIVLVRNAIENVVHENLCDVCPKRKRFLGV